MESNDDSKNMLKDLRDQHNQLCMAKSVVAFSIFAD